MSKKLDEAIRQNQKLNKVNTHVMTASEKEAAKKTKKKKSAFMAFAKGSKSAEPVEIKHYVGIGSSIVLGVCPTKDELAKIYGRTSDNEPNYLGEFEVDGNKVPQARVTVFVQPDPEKYTKDDGNKIPPVQKPFFIAKTYRWNRSKTKLQVIDKYGRTAWVTEAQLAVHEIPMYANGPANLDKDYRPAYLGEETFTNFLKAYLNIPEVMRYVDGKWYMVDNPEDCEARLENIDAIFTGDFSEIKSAIAGMPTNRVKALYGVKAYNGKLYADVYDMFLKNGVTNYTRLAADVEQRKAAGAYPNTEFQLCDFKEYSVEPTDLTAAAPAAQAKNPFDEEPF